MMSGPQQAPAPTQTFGASQYPIDPPASGASVAALVCGILGLLTGWIPIVGFIGLVLAIVAVIAGFIGLQRPNGRGMAIAGLICGALVILLWIGVTVLVIVAAATTHVTS
jgi:hypothetical protein